MLTSVSLDGFSSWYDADFRLSEDLTGLGGDKYFIFGFKTNLMGRSILTVVDCYSFSNDTCLLIFEIDMLY